MLSEIYKSAEIFRWGLPDPVFPEEIEKGKISSEIELTWGILFVEVKIYASRT